MQSRCIDCGIPIKKESRKGRHPKRCLTCREKNKDKWRKIHKEKDHKKDSSL